MQRAKRCKKIIIATRCFPFQWGLPLVSICISGRMQKLNFYVYQNLMIKSWNSIIKKKHLYNTKLLIIIVLKTRFYLINKFTRYYLNSKKTVKKFIFYIIEYRGGQEKHVLLLRTSTKYEGISKETRQKKNPKQSKIKKGKN